jgi:hypothetical protein
VGAYVWISPTSFPSTSIARSTRPPWKVPDRRANDHGITYQRLDELRQKVLLT